MYGNQSHIVLVEELKKVSNQLIMAIVGLYQRIYGAVENQN